MAAKPSPKRSQLLAPEAWAVPPGVKVMVDAVDGPAHEVDASTGGEPFGGSAEAIKVFAAEDERADAGIDDLSPVSVDRGLMTLAEIPPLGGGPDLVDAVDEELGVRADGDLGEASGCEPEVVLREEEADADAGGMPGIDFAIEAAGGLREQRGCGEKEKEEGGGRREATSFDLACRCREVASAHFVTSSGT